MKIKLTTLIMLLTISCQENKVIDGGFALSFCTGLRKECSMSIKERSFWAFYKSDTICNKVKEDLKLYGLKLGDPRCIPCQKIYINSINSLSCKPIQ